MFVSDLRTDFYRKIHGNRVLLLVNFDVDAICASKILQSLFKYDHMIYTMVPVQGIHDMVRAYNENFEEVKFVIFINCGGTIDLVGLLKPEPTIIFYVLDSHRPYDLCNVYSEDQVQILGQLDVDENIPQYDDVFREESEDEEGFESDNSDEDEPAQAKRLRLAEEAIMKKRQFREWNEQRHEIMFNYLQHSYYGRSSSVVVFEMAWKLTRDNLDMLWWAIVGATEQKILGKVESQVSVLEEGNLQNHVARLTHRGSNYEQQHSAVRIVYDKDLSLPLYRHWTVEASIRHSLTAAVKLRLWTMNGETNLRRLLAEMGLPLVQAKQCFSAMDLTLRKEFRQMIEKNASSYQIDNIVGTSFMLQFGYRFKYCASDVVYSMLAYLAPTLKTKSPQECFMDAFDCLHRSNNEVLMEGIEKSKLMLCNIYKTAQSLLESKQVKNAGRFLYAIIPETTVDSKLFSHPHTIVMLAHYMLRAYVECSKKRDAHTLALVVSSVFCADEDVCLIAGVPPVCEDQPRSLFGKAFEKAAENTNMEIIADYFDPTVVRLKTSERSKFLDGLTALLDE